MRTLRILTDGGAEGVPFFRDRDGIWAVRADPAEVMDYTLDWTGWLAGDTISTSSWKAEDATVNSSSNTTSSTTVWATAPTDPYGSVTNTIVTTGGRTKKLRLRLYYQAA